MAGKAKEKEYGRKAASYWKMWFYQREVFDLVSDEEAGEALKLAFRYFDGEDVDTAPLSPGALAAYNSLKRKLDESIEAYKAAVKFGKQGGDAAKANRDAVKRQGHEP